MAIKSIISRLVRAQDEKSLLSAALLLTILVISGCAGTPRTVDVGTLSRATVESSKPSVVKVEVLNRAPDPTFNNNVFSDTAIPIRFLPGTKNIVGDDLQKYFDTHTNKSATSPTAISVVVSKAEAYWIMTTVDKTPFLGLARAGADKTFFLDLNLRVEVERDGKVVSSYPVDRHVTVQGSAAFVDDIEASYKKLIEEYRKELFDELDERFIRRYL